MSAILTSVGSHGLAGELYRKPLPLTTVELQKSGSRLLKLAPKKILDVRSQTIRDRDAT